jgi:hypothetical protein
MLFIFKFNRTVPLFLIVHAKNETFVTLWDKISYYLLLEILVFVSAAVSLLFPPRDNHDICGRQHSALAPKLDVSIIAVLVKMQ